MNRISLRVSPRIVLSRDSVTIDGVWIGTRIYWTLKHITRDYTLQITITQILVFSVTVFHCSAWQYLPTADIPLLQGSRPRRLAAISHQPPTLPTVVSGLSCSQSQSYFTTDGLPPIISSWRQAP
jgi:hypothetical protein